MNRLNLKLRFALAMSVGVLVLVIGTGLVAQHFVEEDLRDTMASQQEALVQRAAADLDAKLRLALETIGAAASGVPHDAFTDADKFQEFYASRPALLKIFDDVIVLDTNGRITADFPSQPERIGLDLHERPFFQKLMATKKPLITEPLKAKLSGHAVVSMVVPILDAKGNVVSAMVGMLRLHRSNFLGSMSLEHLGDSGYFVVMTRGPDPIYLVHPEQRRILTPVELDTNPAFGIAKGDAPVAGVTIGTVDGDREVLISHRALAATGWVLAAVLPTDEAFAPLMSARSHLTAVALIIALCVLPPVWFLAWALLRPLTHLRKEIAAIGDGARRDIAITSNRSDEIGEVARAFNELLARERSLEASRRDSEDERERLVALLEATSDYVAVTDSRGMLTYMNQAARNACGLSPNARISYTSVRDYYPRWVLKLLDEEALPVALKDGIWHGETAVADRRGREIPVEHMLIAHRNADGKITFYASVMHDITRAKANTAALRDSEARMKSIADAVPALVAFIDRAHRYTFVNSAYETHFGLPRDTIVGRTIAELIGSKAFDFYKPFLDRAALGETVVFERESASGIHYVHFRVKLIPQREESGEIGGFHFVHQDVTDHKAEQQRLTGLAHADPLTGLMNRAGFEVSLASAMREATSTTPLALFYLDVDRFKSINDNHGHGIGDLLLKAFCERLLQSLRASDIVARLGGDEFVVIAQGLHDVHATTAIADKMVQAVRAPFRLDGLTLHVTTCVGAVVFSGAAVDANQLLARADAALYRAKRAGRDRAVVEAIGPEREAA